jgi:membrane associated rhomboid family serine protease
MQYRSYRTTGYSSSYFPPGVKWLLISNIGIFVLHYFAIVLLGVDPLHYFGLVPYQVFQGALWQPLTYLFLHGGIGHILFNMLALWMFGADLERDWGTRRFLNYYFLCGIGAGISVILVALGLGGLGIRTIGSSGAIFGVLLAFGLLYPDRIILFSFLFPMKAKYFVIIIGAITFLSSFQAGSGISHIAHLGGMIFGYVYLKTRLRRRRVRVSPSLRERYHDWKVARARRKFQVYMRKHGQDRDPWIH